MALATAGQAEVPPVPAAGPGHGSTSDRHRDDGRHRFTVAAAVAVTLVAPLYVWTACDLWTGSFDLFRYLPYEANFYDLQGRALLHGHLSLQAGSIGLEGFVHDGHTFTYFGLFPSLVRLPV